MPFVELSRKSDPTLKIMLFTEGTIIMHRSLVHLYDFASYIPIGSCVDLIRQWDEQGAEIIYCTSRKGKQVPLIVDVLKRNNYCGTKLYYREKGLTYSQIVEEVMPDILIEDDCRSIGGKEQMCIFHVSEECRDRIHSIPIEEFKGIDHLPVLISALRNA